MVIDEQALAGLDAEQLRELTQRLLGELRHQRALNEKLSYECALLKRMKFAAQSERFNPEQRSLLEEEIEADLAAVTSEIDALSQAQKPAAPEQETSQAPAPAGAPAPARDPPRARLQHLRLRLPDGAHW